MVVWNGSPVILGGRDGYNGRTSKVERFTSGRWELLAPMLRPVEGHSSLVVNDQIWIFGGDNGLEFDGTTAETSFFDGDSWKKGPDLLSRRDGHRSIVLGKSVFHIGGRPLSDYNNWDKDGNFFRRIASNGWVFILFACN